VLLPVFLLPAAAAAVCDWDLTCQPLDCRAPATAVPAALWGELRPVDLGRLPKTRDSTDWSEWFGAASHLTPHWMSLDEENGWVFAAIHFGVEIWDARGALATSPHRTRVLGGSNFPVWLPPQTHESNPVRDIDAPTGYDGLAAVATVEQIGLTVFNTADKGLPYAVYADHGKSAYAVYAATVGNRHYAFLATAADGLLAYDLSAAEHNATPCVESTPLQQGCGVYLGRLGSSSAVRYVHGVGNFLAVSSGSLDFGVEIWDIATPAAPRLRIDGLPTTQGVHGVTLWQRAGRTYLAARIDAAGASGSYFQIYDLSCLTTDSCGGTMPAPLSSRWLPGSGSGEYFISHSVTADGRDFLYLGSANRCNVGEQFEWLVDVSTAGQPRDVTPPARLVAGAMTGYWGWYYRRNPTGFNRVTPRSGIFVGQIFYRAAYSLFDLHELASDRLFADGFESGGFQSWAAVQ
jgi:hypothetical protein